MGQLPDVLVKDLMASALPRVTSIVSSYGWDEGLINEKYLAVERFVGSQGFYYGESRAEAIKGIVAYWLKAVRNGMYDIYRTDDYKNTLSLEMLQEGVDGETFTPAFLADEVYTDHHQTMSMSALRRALLNRMKVILLKTAAHLDLKQRQNATTGKGEHWARRNLHQLFIDDLLHGPALDPLTQKPRVAFIAPSPENVNPLSIRMKPGLFNEQRIERALLIFGRAFSAVTNEDFSLDMRIGRPKAGGIYSMLALNNNTFWVPVEQATRESRWFIYLHIMDHDVPDAVSNSLAVDSPYSERAIRGYVTETFTAARRVYGKILKKNNASDRSEKYLHSLLPKLR